MEYQKEKLTILIPLMNREENLKVFIPYIKNYLKRNSPEIIYDIVIIEQVNDKPFNKGILFNAGFVLTSGNTDYYALHDVDQLPISSTYKYYDHPVHTCVNCIEQSSTSNFINTYEKSDFLQKGGCIIIDKYIYEKANGHSNNYWGWGCIDDDFMIRLYYSNNIMYRYDSILDGETENKNKIGYYITLNADTKRYYNDPNFIKNRNYLFYFFKIDNEIYKKDGLNSLNYELLEVVNEKEYIRYKITF